MERRTESSLRAAERPGSYLLDYDTVIELSVELGDGAITFIETINS